MKNLTYILTLLLILYYSFFASSIVAQSTDAAFDTMANEMAHGDVKDISVKDLKSMKHQVILLDTRGKEEYEISHIPGAIWVGYDNFKMENVEGIDKNSEIVTYCSVGYRSERIGEKLQKAGFNNVSNLKGSIFKWINEGYQVEDKDGNTTDRIHGFNEDWGRWVKDAKVVY